MKNIYCTLFNYDYLTRGLVLYHSMEQCLDRFHLYILAMDTETEKILEDQNFSNVSIIRVEDIIDERMKSVLGERPGPSFFWTCTPIIIEYILKARNEQWVTYIDADCFMIKDPGKVFDIIEKGGYSVGVVEHRFRKDGDYEKLCSLDGRFNVAFNTFRNEENSLKILAEWKDQCIECCTNKPTGVVFGDQLYLNEWPDKYDRIYILEDDGIDVAPWNVNNYRFFRKDGSYMIENENATYEVSMYHFHALRFMPCRLISLNLWHTKPRSEERFIFELYREYVNALYRQQIIVDGYPQYFRPVSSMGILQRIRTFYSKYKNRDENGIIGISRNVIRV